MSTSLIILLSIGAPAIILLLIGIIIALCNSKKKAHCTCQTVGKVYGYRYAGGNGDCSVAPRAEFYVGGQKYKAYRHYKGVVASTKITPDPDSLLGNQDSFWISEKDWFHINKKGLCTNYKKMAQEVWPVGSNVTILYNPDKPRQAYVDKIVVNTVVPIVFIGCGLLLILSAVMGYILFL